MSVDAMGRCMDCGRQVTSTGGCVCRYWDIKVDKNGVETWTAKTFPAGIKITGVDNGYNDNDSEKD